MVPSNHETMKRAEGAAEEAEDVASLLKGKTRNWEVVAIQNKDVSENSGTPKSSISIGFSIINHPFWGTPIFGNTHKFHQNVFGIFFHFLVHFMLERTLFMFFFPCFFLLRKAT